ncbi:MAG TPA: sigma-54 dependent transcriptional regulator [Burkholderiaceae bacterium]|nr:sigma-54 dependent transcriptional regulator [Burkholderiaceae bacterium]
MTDSTTTPQERRADGRRIPAVLVVDDEADLRELLSLTLVRMGLDVDTADSLEQARAQIGRRRHALILTDMRLPDGNGIDLVREVAVCNGAPIAVITAFGSADTAVAALKAGAFDYLSKPVDLDQLRLLVRSAVRQPFEATSPRTPAGAPIGAAARLLGEAPAMQQLRAMIAKLAHSMAPVAIFGESGSGKELVARSIHEASARRAAPFVAVNCGAIPETLMEAEFFGYRKGAFTGADRDRDGFFQAAAGGTLFLDEVAELPLPMQVKLLRAIQERRVRKLGATQEDPVDVRLLSATHQDLSKLVAAGRFRQDLFYRLNVIELRVPGLRQRAQDIPLIARDILARLAARAAAPAAELTPAAEQVLMAYGFPGNVRELENVLERAVALTVDGTLRPIDLMLPQAEVDLLLEPPDAPAAAEPITAPLAGDAALAAATAPLAGDAAYALKEGVPADLPAYLDALERDAIRAALLRTRNNRTAAAQLLGITFRQLRYRMQRLGLR